MECGDLPRKLIIFTAGLPRGLGHIPGELGEGDDIANGAAEGHGVHAVTSDITLYLAHDGEMVDDDGQWRAAGR